jgi:prepilin-type N-terminal cleavage/methylation domain-containing protein
MKKGLILFKRGFTLIEMVIVLLIIGILMGATMKFGSGRIVDLKAQSTKEQFIGRYNDIYSQNMTSSFRNGKKYETLTIVMDTGVYYIVDELAQMNSDLIGFEIHNIHFDADVSPISSATIEFVPYQL